MNGTLRSLLLGLATGDALGVPYEFRPRRELEGAPCTGMVGFGTHHQPPGTWSDDTSMALVITEVFARSGTLQEVAQGFVAWIRRGHWTPWGHVFDYGGATAAALSRVERGVDCRHSGGRDEASNGNGSVMRTAPLAWFLRNELADRRRQTTFEVSAITHAHPRSLLGCWLVVEVGVALLEGLAREPAVDRAWTTVDQWVATELDWTRDWNFYSRCRPSVAAVERSQIASTGYVVHTVEAALWCLLTSATYEEAVLKAVNLGDDTDTTGAVTGALAGLCFGEGSIPVPWLSVLARRDDIEELARADER